MSSLRSPVGPQTPRVYWRRRIVVGVGALAIVIALVLIIVRPGAGEASPAPGITSSAPAAAPVVAPSAGGSGSGSGSGSVGGSQATPAPAPTNADGSCTTAAVKVTAVTDADAYAATQQPKLSLTIENTGPVACTIAAGSDVQEYVITSGADRIWSSKDCQKNPVAQVVTLQPGKPVSTSPFAWDRTRSSTTTCDGSRPAVTAGGASYHLGVVVGPYKGASTKQFLLK